jgi:hypothetical protein
VELSVQQDKVPNDTYLYESSCSFDRSLGLGTFQFVYYLTSVFF